MSTAPFISIEPERTSAALIHELVDTLTGPRRDGRTQGGRPCVQLFGELVDLAVPLRSVLEAVRRGDPAVVRLDAVTLRLHARAASSDDGYLVGAPSPGEADDPDAASLRLLASWLSSPVDALLRAKPGDPRTWLEVVLVLREATERALVDDDGGSSTSRITRLHDHLKGLTRVDDPRLPRVMAELLVHTWMALRALDRQPAVRREGGSRQRLVVARALPEATLADLRWAAGRRGSWRDHGMLRTVPDLARGRGRGGPPHSLEIRPLFRGSAGRWLEVPTEDGISVERRVVFAPHTPFEVVEVVEHRGTDGTPRTLVRLTERSRAAVELASEARPARARVVPQQPVFHYTTGQALAGIVADGEIGVSEPPAGVRAPVVWLSTRDDWEPSAGAMTEGAEPLTREQRADRGRGLFRIAVDPGQPLLTAEQWVQWAEVPADVAEVLEGRGRDLGAEPSQWLCCPTAVDRAHWQGIELWHPERGWMPYAP